MSELSMISHQVFRTLALPDTFGFKWSKKTDAIVWYRESIGNK